MRLVRASLIVLGVLLAMQLIVRVLARLRPMPAPLLFALPRNLIAPVPQTLTSIGVTPGQVVLEIGAGSGRVALPVAERLAEASGTLYAVDVNQRALDRMRDTAERREIRNLVAVQADAHTLPFREGMFDLTYLVDTLGEIPNIEDALEEVYRVLKPGGTLSISEFLVDPHFHFQWEVRDLVMWAGFEEVDMHGNWAAYTLNFRKM